MARSGRGGRRARRQVKQPTASLPTIGNLPKTTARRSNNRQSSNAVTEFIGAGQNLIGKMTQYGIGGVQKVQTCLGEILGETATQLAFSTSRIAATPRATMTRRATGGRRARKVAGGAPPKLSKAQQTVLNALGIGEQVPAATIAQRAGMQSAAVVRALNPLKRKNYVGSLGRGKQTNFWKIQTPQQAAAAA